MKAVITINDDNGSVEIKVHFGKAGINEDSAAHYLALLALNRIAEETKKRNGATDEA